MYQIATLIGLMLPPTLRATGTSDPAMMSSVPQRMRPGDRPEGSKGDSP